MGIHNLKNDGLSASGNNESSDYKKHRETMESFERDEQIPFDCTYVLIIEDDLTTANYINHAIKKAAIGPVRIKTISSSEKASEYIFLLKQFKMPGPDVAIVDYFLSGTGDGLWICDFLKKRFPDTQVILTSSLNLERISDKLFMSETKPIFFQKPFEAKRLKNLLFS